MTNRSGMKWKVCGMRDASNIQEVLALAPHFMGFIFYPKSPRYVGDDWTMPDFSFDQTKTVGVFVNEPKSSLLQKAQRYELDLIQLHGDEDDQYCQELYDQGLKLIKAIAVSGKEDFKKCQSYKPWVQYFLFDTKSSQYGGTGRSFDWSLLDHYDQEVPFVLSGGLTSEYNGQYPTDWNLAFIDVNSRFEVKPGVKNVDLLEVLKKNLL